MAKEKVCIVAPYYPAVGGLTTVIRQLIKGLHKRYRVTLLSIKWMEEEEHRLVHYNISLNPKLKPFFNPWHLPTIIPYELSGAIWCLILRILNIRKFLVQEAIASAFFVTLIGKMTGAQVYIFDYGPMLYLHDPKFVKAPSKYRSDLLTIIYAELLKRMNKFSLRRCYKFFAYNQELEKCAHNNGLQNGKTVHYNLPIDTTTFRPYNFNERKKAREKLGIQGDECAITYIGRISKGKGLSYLLKSAKTLIEKNPSRVKFIIVGDGPLTEWFLANTAEYRPSHIVFLGPINNSKKLAEILNASDIFLYPITVSYGYALALLEAMATGLPGIITDVGPTKELITNGYNGIVVPAKNAQALSNALELLIKNQKLRKRIGNNAKKMLSKFSAKNFQEIVLDTIA